MDELYKNTINQLNIKKNTHPNIMKLWNIYLKEKRKNFINDMNKCIEFVNKIQNEDLSLMNILSLYIILNDN